MNSLGIPSALSEVEATTLSQLAAGKVVLEVGSLLGFSTITMALVADKVVSIDPHEGYPAANPRPTWAEFNGNLERFGVDENVLAFKEYDAFIETDEVAWHGPYDLCFIDATGIYADTIRIMERADQVLALDNSFMCVHDYGLFAWPGAGEAVRDYCTQRALNFGVVDTLAIIRPGHPDD